ncbi:MAG: ribosome biogenesis GTP-binding protein YihA/YsxC [Christensenellaceae bacterium]|jgi:GTP-binding protein|nr:ribosome biogenesis GTP-binding protein YihA/YsxC [Christensenellaceae bacterium]
MIIKNTKFFTSIADSRHIPVDGIPEIAISGKSNVGKSTFINFITGSRKLAKTSKDPGRTRLLNYFSCNDNQFYIVDLPGYGFARVSDSEKKKWGILIDGYLQNSKALKNVFVLIDIRRDPSNDDKMLINFLYYHQIAMTIVLTKADKLPKTALMKRKKEIASDLAVGIDNIIVISALEKIGKERIEERIEEILQTDNNKNDT